MANYKVIGLPNKTPDMFNANLLDLFLTAPVFSGGKRHYELVKKFLPEQHQWITISADMVQLVNIYKTITTPIVVFASGDPLFYGIAATIQKYDSEAVIDVYPYFNSIQLLCHKSNISYQQVKNTSVHGRSWQELDQALIEGHNLISVLTDSVKNPATIAERMLTYNFNNYEMIIGEDLEGTKEHIQTLPLKHVAHLSLHQLNCVLLVRLNKKEKSFGIPDSDFMGLDGRPNMITKMPVRLISLSKLDLINRQSLWDIGFCTASLAIEAKKQFPHLTITAFEKRSECAVIFDYNTQKHSSPGINKIMGDFFELDLKNYPVPDTIFIGGHGNSLEELLHLLDKIILPKARIVINAVLDNSKTVFITTINKLNYKLIDITVIKVDAHNPISIITAEK